MARVRARAARRRPFTIAVYRAVRALATTPGAKLPAAPFHALNVVLHAGAPPPAALRRAALALTRSAGATAQVHGVAAHFAQLEGHPAPALSATLAGACAAIAAAAAPARPR
jgi:hypothetical protein